MAHQVLHVFPLLLLAQIAILLVRMVAGTDFPGLIYFAASATGAALWPLITVLLPDAAADEARSRAAGDVSKLAFSRR